MARPSKKEKNLKLLAIDESIDSLKYSIDISYSAVISLANKSHYSKFFSSPIHINSFTNTTITKDYKERKLKIDTYKKNQKSYYTNKLNEKENQISLLKKELSDTLEKISELLVIDLHRQEELQDLKDLLKRQKVELDTLR